MCEIHVFWTKAAVKVEKIWKLDPKKGTFYYLTNIFIMETEKHFFFFFSHMTFALLLVDSGYLPKIMVKSLLTNSRGLQGVAAS